MQGDSRFGLASFSEQSCDQGGLAHLVLLAAPGCVSVSELAAAGDARPSGDYAIITREDGGRQWTYKGRPLYAWIKDCKPGDATGNGLNKVWHAVKP